MKELNFCTYFDKNYLIKGLTMYRSLERQLKCFTMWILCFDDITYDVLNNLNLKNARLISLRDFEDGDSELLKAKSTRTAKEYCWTITPSLPLFILKESPKIETITYLDADLLFFKNPRPIFEKFEGKSILIIEHRYHRKYCHFEKLSGIYNVAMIVFRNDDNGIQCLTWWRERCNEWCYARMEDGKFGDQKYLDDWPERFHGVYVLKHKGVDLAPWNIENYNLRKIDGKLMVDENEVIFFHYHSTFRISEKAIEVPKGYRVTRQYMKLIYEPYAKGLHEALLEVRLAYPNFSYGIDKINIWKLLRGLISGRICFYRGKLC